MSAAEFLAMAPLLVLAFGCVAMMAMIAFIDQEQTAALVAVAYLLLAVLCVPLAASGGARAVGALLVIDAWALFFTTLFLIGGALVVLQASEYPMPGYRKGELYLLLMLASLGAAVLVSSRHFATLFLGLELLGISLVAMVAYPVGWRGALEGGVKYLVLSGASTGIVLFGIALLYAATGSLEFSGSALHAAPAMPLSELWMAAGLALLLAGFAFKLSLVPFHLWTPDVYQGAPAPVTGFLATVSKGAVAAALFRYLAESGAWKHEPVIDVLIVIAVVSMLAGNLLALLQDNMRRILAYSSIAHLGYLLVAFITLAADRGDVAGEALGAYIVAYLVTTLGAFGVIAHLAAVRRGREPGSLDEYRGLFWSRPWLAAAFTLILLSLAGIPLTVGFIGKFYIFAAGASASHWGLLVAVVAGSAIGLFYYLRIILFMIRPAAGGVTVSSGLPPLTPARFALAVLALFLVWFGVAPGGLIAAIRGAVHSIV